VVDALLELARCGLWDLSALELDGFVDPIPVQCNKITTLPAHENNDAMI
jgi:hypothetical protein